MNQLIRTSLRTTAHATLLLAAVALEVVQAFLKLLGDACSAAMDLVEFGLRKVQA